MRRTPINNNIQRTHSRIFKYPLYLYQINPQPIIAASRHENPTGQERMQTTKSAPTNRVSIIYYVRLAFDYEYDDITY